MNYTRCGSCKGTFSLSSEVLHALWKTLPEEYTALDYLDEVHKCCPDPYHYWLLKPKPERDLSELVLKSLKDFKQKKEIEE